MIKKVTRTEDVVMCDVCGKETGHSGDSAYAKGDKHFCMAHVNIERLYKELGDLGLLKTQKILFREAKGEAISEVA